ncbi:unnamed protein product [Linum trigynum]|uniref:Thionin-like protein 2 n=1 Tax=Linum trigynum TaxID=586398 RepID=A0AAV2EMP4_9ROSI
METSKRNYRCPAAGAKKMMAMGLVAALLSLAAVEAGQEGGGIRPRCCTGCYRGCFSDCMTRQGDNLNTIDPFICSAECFVHCIFNLYTPPLSAQTFCTAGCAVSKCSKFSSNGHPNTGKVESCVDSCSRGCSKNHDQYA